MPIFKKLTQYLTESLNVTIVPSPKHKIRRINISRIVPIIVMLVIIISISTLGFLYHHYYNNYYILNTKLEKLKGVRIENEKLKNELYALTQDTEKLRNELSQLKEYNDEIKNMIEPEGKNEQARENSELKLELKTFFDKNITSSAQGLPVGGGELRLYYLKPEAMINRARDNIHKLKEELPSQEKSLSSLENSVIEYKNIQSSTPKVWPLADEGESYISSGFGWRKDPFTGRQQIHEGIDIATWYNTPVLSTADGKIVFAGWEGGYGRLVVIEHGYGFKTKYAHLNKISVKKGQKVKRGDVVAFSGNSGRSKGPHLHYEVLKNSIPQNPRNYVGR